MNTLDYFNARLEATISPMDYMRASKANPDEYILIDVRNGPPHVRNITIQGAMIIPQQELAERLDEIPRDKEIILYCWDVWCNTAAKAAVYLLKDGFKVKELSGGIAAWNEMNLPVSDVKVLPDNCGC
ncbi:rhodanese-like domain-containing protein [Terribacillus saccharophilus]|uniref:rhodanese-like domain-containing protein n=1 Tax=Terribacillus saccharophilus TaxID=361277 RepID=UPI00398266A1